MEILGFPIAIVAFWIIYILYKSVGEKQLFGDRCIECQSILNDGATRCAKCGTSVASFREEQTPITEIPSSIKLDTVFYRELYSDLKSMDDVELSKHWQQYGYQEGRIGSEGHLNLVWGLKTCPVCISQTPFIASKCKFCGTDLVV